MTGDVIPGSSPTFMRGAVSERFAGWQVYVSLLRVGRPAIIALGLALTILVVVADLPGTLVGSDGLRYWWASHDFLSGHSPWDRFYGGGSYAGSPTAVLAFVPFALLPPWAFLAIWFPLTVASAVYIVRRLGLSWWWLLYPPLIDGVMRLQPTVVLVALVLAGLGGLAAALKVIAIPPLIGDFRWRALAIFVAISGASFLAAPALWLEYVARFTELSDRLLRELPGSPPLLTIPAALAAISLGPRRAGWLLIPVAWPGWEYHYGVLLLPVAGPIALAGALPWRESVMIAVIAVALWEVSWRPGWLRAAQPIPGRVERSASTAPASP
jgi:hypothetical protein